MVQQEILFIWRYYTKITSSIIFCFRTSAFVIASSTVSSSLPPVMEPLPLHTVAPSPSQLTSPLTLVPLLESFSHDSLLPCHHMLLIIRMVQADPFLYKWHNLIPSISGSPSSASFFYKRSNLLYLGKSNSWMDSLIQLIQLMSVISKRLFMNWNKCLILVSNVLA